MIIYLTLLVALIGLLMYVLATRAEVKEVGRLMFFAGLLSFLLTGGAILDVIRK